MVRIAGTLTSNISLAGRGTGQNFQPVPGQVNPVNDPPLAPRIDDREPDMTFGGIGRRIDIRV
jgi:hypothetical protein